LGEIDCAPDDYPAYGDADESFAITYPTAGLHIVLSKGFGPIGQDAPVTTRSPRTSPRRVRRWIRRHPADVMDLFVYVVVLNLAVQYVPSVISETFTLSLLTAVLLKVALEAVLRLKSRILSRFRAATTRPARWTAAALLWVAAAGSKIVVLEMVDLVFGDAVSLGNFISVTLLVLTLLLSRAAVRRLLYGTGTDD
jgi:hypothetical protein